MMTDVSTGALKLVPSLTVQVTVLVGSAPEFVGLELLGVNVT